ncbi:hypothetical protein HK104_003421 [Borealophlyctis nickersoniae]|nr:hypothetical protein HK104_003421 [Borealophlyctis nickersoniae]
MHNRFRSIKGFVARNLTLAPVEVLPDEPPSITVVPPEDRTFDHVPETLPREPLSGTTADSWSLGDAPAKESLANGSRRKGGSLRSVRSAGSLHSLSIKSAFWYTHRRNSSAPLSPSSMHQMFHERYKHVAKASVPDLIHSYFTLSAVDARDDVDQDYEVLPYVSESLTSFLQFCLRVFAKRSKDDHFQMLVEEHVNLRNLHFVTAELADGPKPFPRNTVLLLLEDGYYRPNPNVMDDVFEEYPVVKVQPQRVRNSYKFGSLVRITSAQGEIWNLQSSIRSLILEGEALLAARDKVQAEPNDCKSRISMIEREIMQQTQLIQNDRLRLREARELIKARTANLEESLRDRHFERQNLERSWTAVAIMRTERFRVSSMITQRQRDLVSDLNAIFPIEQSTFDPALYTIREIRLPNSEYSGQDEERIATALGYVAHLVSMVAFYLNIPLRYPMKLMSSRSTILDTVSQQYQGSKEFPLHSRGVERFRFEYGVFLVNKNIEQLMNYMSLSVTNLRNTLPNLQLLIKTIVTAKGEDDVDGYDFNMGADGSRTSVRSASPAAQPIESTALSEALARKLALGQDSDSLSRPGSAASLTPLPVSSHLDEFVIDDSGTPTETHDCPTPVLFDPSFSLSSCNTPQILSPSPARASGSMKAAASQGLLPVVGKGKGKQPLPPVLHQSGDMFETMEESPPSAALYCENIPVRGT